MKNKLYLMFVLLISCFTIFTLSSCKNLELSIEPVQEYLTSNVEVKQKNKKSGSIELASTENTVDYSFTVTSNQIIETNVSNPNDLITGENPFLLNAVVSNYSIDETTKKFNPIIEMSSSGFGNAPLSLDKYNEVQYRTCYAITQSGEQLQSSYYNVAIVITDDEAPTTTIPNLVIRPEISYKNSLPNDEENLKFSITSNYVDNNGHSRLSVDFYDSTFKNKKTATQVLNEIRKTENLISNNQINPQNIYYKVKDESGNETENQTAGIILADDAAPYVMNTKTNKIINISEVLKDITMPVPNMKDHIKNMLINMPEIQFVDEVCGIVNKNNIEASCFENKFYFRISDANNNYLEYTSAELNEVGMYFSPNSNIEDINQALAYEFMSNNEIKITGPYIGKTLAIMKNWMGTDGNGNIYIPATINLNGTEYKVTRTEYETFSYALKCNSVYSGDNDPIKYVYDFSETNIDYFDHGLITANTEAGITNTLIINNLSGKPITIIGSAFEGFDVTYLLCDVKLAHPRSIWTDEIYVTFDKTYFNAHPEIFTTDDSGEDSCFCSKMVAANQSVMHFSYNPNEK